MPFSLMIVIEIPPGMNLRQAAEFLAEAAVIAGCAKMVFNGTEVVVTEKTSVENVIMQFYTERGM